VQLGHAGVVKELIKNNGDLFSSRPPAITMPHSTEQKSCLATILDSRNAQLISKMVQGVREAPKLLELLSVEDFLSFLKQRDGVPLEAMNAIFQPCRQFFYWEETGGELRRRKALTGHVNIKDGCNIMEGPHCQSIMKKFTTKTVIDPETLGFIDQLLPTEGSSCTTCGPVSMFMCHVPLVHKDLRVLVALADCPNSDVFSTDGCRAIIAWRWKVERSLARFRMVMAGIEVANFMAINFFTDETAPSWVGGPLHFTIFVSLLVWSLAMYMELSQILGFICTGLGRRYLASPRHWFDLTLVVMTGVVSFALLDKSVAQDNTFCTAFGALVFCKWTRFLVDLRQIEAVGIEILPITDTMWDIGPFLLVFSVYFLASVNMFYALNTGHSFIQCFMQVYQLVVLGSGNSATLANTDAPKMTMDLITGAVFHSAPPEAGNLFVVRVMLIFVSFVIGVSLMNLFLAVLCVAYTQARNKAHLSFMRSRTKVVMDQHAIRAGAARIGCYLQRQTTKKLIYPRSASEMHMARAYTLPGSMFAPTHAFLWIAKPTA